MNDLDAAALRHTARQALTGLNDIEAVPSGAQRPVAGSTY